MTVAARSQSKDEPSQASNARKRRSAPKKGRRVLRLRNVSLRNQHDHLVLNSVSASFTRGTISAILTGYRDLPWPPHQEPSPFLLACAGLTPLESGRVSWPRPRSLAARFRGELEPIGYVPRRCALNDELTVEQELMLALASTGRFADHQAMLSLCRILVLTPLLNAQIALLTPFERLRTAIARALITGTPLLLVEEPTEFLSAEESEDLFGHLFELADMGYSIIVATRSPEVAAQSDQALILIDGEVVGNISQPDYHALNLEFSTALKSLHASEPMAWVSSTDDAVVTIDDDELLDADFDEEDDGELEDDGPSMHPTWVPVVPSTRERQLRPIPLAVPPVPATTPSRGVPTGAAATAAPHEVPHARAEAAAAGSDAVPASSAHAHAREGADLGEQSTGIPKRLFPPVSVAQASASADSTVAPEVGGDPLVLHADSTEATSPGASASLPPIPTVAPIPAATPEPAAHGAPIPTAYHTADDDVEILTTPTSQSQEHLYPSTTTLPQIPRPATGPLSEDSTEVLTRAQRILTELPGPVLPLMNKDQRRNTR